jgi:hypothetical protein
MGFIGIHLLAQARIPGSTGIPLNIALAPCPAFMPAANFGNRKSVAVNAVIDYDDSDNPFRLIMNRRQRR